MASGSSGQTLIIETPKVDSSPKIAVPEVQSPPPEESGFTGLFGVPAASSPPAREAFSSPNREKELLSAPVDFSGSRGTSPSPPVPAPPLSGPPEFSVAAPRTPKPRFEPSPSGHAPAAPLFAQPSPPDPPVPPFPKTPPAPPKPPAVRLSPPPAPARSAVSPPPVKLPPKPAASLPKSPPSSAQATSGPPLLPLILIVGGSLLVVGALVVYLITK